MAKLASIRPKDLVRAIAKIGFYRHHQVGSHATYRHDDGRRVTIPMHNRELRKGTLHGILKDIELSIEDLKKLL
jgi:predicted RNA binding protein YcfA (HicA-like mRNA interferase family)